MQQTYYGGPQVIANRPVVNTGGIPPGVQPSLAQQVVVPPEANNKPKHKIRRIYSQKTTKNKSFLDMHHYLKSIGVKNNEFMLTLLDPDLDGIDPHDPHLNAFYKQKVLRECMCNYW